MAETINRTISITAQDEGAVGVIERLREAGTRMFEDIKKRAEGYARELDEQADKIQDLIDKERELKEAKEDTNRATKEGTGLGSIDEAGGAESGAGGRRGAMGEGGAGGRRGGGGADGGKSEAEEEVDEELDEQEDEEDDRAEDAGKDRKSGGTGAFLGGLGLFGLGALLATAVGQAKEALQQEAMTRGATTGLDGSRIDAGNERSWTQVGINRIEEAMIKREATRRGGAQALGHVRERIGLERAFGMERNELARGDEFLFNDGALPTDLKATNLIAKMINSNIWSLDGMDVPKIAKGIENMLDLNKAEYGLFANFTGLAGVNVLHKVAQAGGMFNDPNRQTGLIMGMHSDITSGGNPFIDAMINESILRQNPDLAMSPIGMTKLRAKRARGMFEEGNLEGIIQLIRNLSGGDTEQAVAFGTSIFSSLLPHVGTDDIHGELGKFFTQVPKEGSASNTAGLKKLIDDKEGGAMSKAEGYQASMDNSMIKMGVLIRKGLDPAVATLVQGLEHVSSTIDDMANDRVGTWEGIATLLGLPTWMRK